jgi:hypothetical protein
VATNRAVLVAGLVLLIAIGVGLGFFLRRSTAPSGAQASVNDAVACATAKSSFAQTPRSLGAFTDFVSQPVTADPLTPFHVGPLQHHFLGGQVEGRVTSIAFEPKYKSENDQYARAAGYTPGKEPLVPLRGHIVTDHPGLLEVYESHFVYSDNAGAKAMGAIRDLSAHELTVPAGNSVPEATVVAFESAQPSADQEMAITVRGVEGNMAVGFSFQGGMDLRLEQVWPMVKQSLEHVRSCSGATTN